MYITRQYLNAAGDVIRCDSINMINPRDGIGRLNTEITYQRDLKIAITYITSASRTVDKISITGDYTSIETSTGNFVWAAWTSPAARCDMSDLPAVGEDV